MILGNAGDSPIVSGEVFENGVCYRLSDCVMDLVPGMYCYV